MNGDAFQTLAAPPYPGRHILPKTNSTLKL